MKSLRHRFSRKDSKQKTNSKEKTVKEIKAEIDSDPELKAKLEAAGVDINDKNSVEKSIYSAMAVAGFLALTSAPAEAGWVSDLAKQLSKSISDTIKPIFGSIMQSFGGDLFKSMDKGSGQAITAIGMQTDAINQVQNTIANEKIKAATQPKPDHCRSDALGAESQKADRRKEYRSNIYALKINNYVYDQDGKKILKEITRQAKEYRGAKLGQNLIFGNINKSDGLNNAESLKTAEDVATNILGTTASITTQNLQKLMSVKGDEDIVMLRQAKMATQGSRIQIAMSPINAQIAANNNTTGKSRNKIFKEELDRTYGDRDGVWRNEINNAIDPAPLAAEMCKLLAFQNKLMFEQLVAIEQGNVILGTSLLEAIESSPKSFDESKI